MTETKKITKTKKWERDTQHGTYAAAKTRLDALGMNKTGEGKPEAKIRKNAKGFAVVTWRGEVREAQSDG